MIWFNSNKVNSKHYLVTYLHFDWGVELCVRSGGCRPRDRWRPEEVPGRRVQFRGDFFIRLQLRLVLQVPLHLVACLEKKKTRGLVKGLQHLKYPAEPVTLKWWQWTLLWLKFNDHKGGKWDYSDNIYKVTYIYDIIC